MKRFLALFTLVLAVSFSGITNAEVRSELRSKITSIDLDQESGAGAQKCDEDAESMSACRSFIKGFLQGALITDTAIIKSIEENTEPSFAERAFRTRLGKQPSSPTALAGFCLPPGRTILDLAEETLDHVKDSKRNSPELAKKVYESLKVDYPCS